MTTDEKRLRPVPNEDLRRRYMAIEAVADERDKERMAKRHAIFAEINAATDQLRERHKAEIAAAEQPFQAQLTELSFCDRFTADEQREVDAIEEQLGDVRWINDYEQMAICDLTGVPLFDSDDVIEDSDGTMILRAVLPFPAAADAAESEAATEDAP